MDSTTKKNLIISKSVLIISGIFEYDKSFQKKITTSGYINEKTRSEILNTSKATGTISSRIESKS